MSGYRVGVGGYPVPGGSVVSWESLAQTWGPTICKYSSASPWGDTGEGARRRNSPWDNFFERGGNFLANPCLGGVSC